MGFSRSTCCWQLSLGNPTGVEQEHQALFLPFAGQYPSLVRRSYPRENESRVFDLIPKYPFQNIHPSDAQAPSEASHVEPYLWLVNMTILFPRALGNRYAIPAWWDAWTKLTKPQLTAHRASHGLLAHGPYSWAKHHKHSSPVSSLPGKQQVY